jgi:putative Mg2+ transporter-C (MgtC) family protein
MQEAPYRLLMALACGAVVGLNRHLHRESAGFRTFSVVSVGSAVVALDMSQSSSDANAVSRTGIGFLGAGGILHQPPSSRVTGLATAAAIWLTAVLGLTAGLGLFRLATAGLVVAFVILLIGRPIESYLRRIFPSRHSKTRRGSARGPANPRSRIAGDEDS